jgi:hypothetical protein
MKSISLLNHSGRTMAVESTQLLTEMITMVVSWSVKADVA